MAERPKSGMRNVILVWIIGLTLGVAAGAATAMLLMPRDAAVAGSGQTLAERFRLD
jgi:gas vesicle protein